MLAAGLLLGRSLAPASLAEELTRGGLTVAVVLAFVVAPWLHQPGGRRARTAWRVGAVGAVLLAAGQLLASDAALALGGLDASGPLERLLVASAFALFGAAVLLLGVAQTPDSVVEGVIDVLIIGLGASVALWSLAHVLLDVVGPTGPTSTLVQTMLVLAPAVALGALLRPLVSRAAMPPAAAWLVLAVVLTLAAALAWAQAPDAALVATGTPGLTLLAGIAAFAVGALHPSMPRLTDPVALSRQRVGWLRLGILVVALLAAPLPVVLDRGAQQLELVLPLVGASALVLLVVAQMRGTLQEQHRTTAALREQAVLDGLTGLPDRAALRDQLQAALAAQQRLGGQLAVVVVDLDGFRRINDVHGHLAGDRVLRAAAARLRAAVADDDLLARFAGDEFVVVARGRSHEGTLALAEGLVEAVRGALPLEGAEGSGLAEQVEVAATAGIAFPDPDQDPDDAISDAQQAVAAARAADRAVEVFGDRLRAELGRRLQIERALVGAAQRDELFVVYQPLVHLDRHGSPGRLVGLEALLRWSSPELGIVSPGEFIPVAERTGAIDELGRWVVERAARELAERAGRDERAASLTVFVNLSPAQLDPRLLAHVRAVLAATGLAPEQLGLEITETAVLGDDDSVLEVLDALAGLGVSLALDDFGTGYSSLQRLQRLPVDLIKVDRSFVSGLDQEEATDSAIVAAVAGLGRGLGVPVLAEGVETPAQLQGAFAAGCSVAQGYLLGRPAPLEDALAPPRLGAPTARRPRSRLLRQAAGATRSH